MTSRGGRSPGSSSSGGKRSVPMHIDYDSLNLGDKDESGKLRRPVRPVDRQRMRPWLMELLDLGNVYGLNWTNRPQGVFQISWRHASRLGWNLETDGDVFERWARHTGIYKEGDPPEPKRWKANFRCALHSLHDVVELTTVLERRGRNACRTYRFLHSSDERSVNKKRAKAKKAKEYHRYERPVREEVVIQEIPDAQQTPVYEFVTTNILSNEDIEPATESESEEETKQDRVIVQQLELKSDAVEEELGLHHDHDYSVLPDKSQKTIVLRQGIGSIVLHKEVLGAPEGEVKLGELQKSVSSNLDQLASAAVSTAGWNTVLAPGLSSSSAGRNKTVKHKIKTKLSAKELAAARLMKNEDQRAAYSLKYLLTGNAEDAEEEPNTLAARLGKKRKAESVPDQDHPSISVGAEETVSTEAILDGDAGETLAFVPPKASKIHRRTASPRILSGAKARRQRSKSEKTDSESTEPLMSSCLLLLEAATRLDNAEKDKTTDGVRTRGKARGSARTSMTSAAARAAGKIIDKHDSESDGDSESSSTNQADDTMIITADQDLHRVLRKTLESLKNRNSKLPKQVEESTITIDLGEGVWGEGTELTDAVMVVSETEDVKGLFSGSSIEHQSSRKEEADPGMTDVQTEGHAEETVELAETAVIEEAVIDTEQGAEYIEMVIPEEEGVAYIEGDSVPSEIIIETADGEQQLISKDQSGSITTSALLEHIPPGSILLQTADGTPIGIIDAQGKLTAFQSPEARSVITALSSKVSASSAQQPSTTGQSVESSDTLTAAVKASTSSEAQLRLSTSSSPLTQESPQPGTGELSMSSVVVKQEPVAEEAEMNQELINTDVVVKVERMDSTDQDSTSTVYTNSSANGFLSLSAEAAANPHAYKGKICQCLLQSVLEGLTSPYTFEGILSNCKKFQLHKAKLCSCPPGSRNNVELFPAVKLERLEDLCKSYIIGQCFAALSLEATQKVATTTKASSTKQHQSKKITVLPGVQLPLQRQQALKSNSDVTYDTKTVIDPTTPFSLGEIPLFESTKVDSDSMSPPSE
ncbi:interferon regulatory factor [Elysia marginata]|uniref:Interferon regulatory factor n=1 Tax=Elysia marginata TaxID=1093978 RepID=A0AAV4F8I6_9GAST|nr:interferon regulatory factor [Elysia marginata]